MTIDIWLLSLGLLLHVFIIAGVIPQSLQLLAQVTLASLDWWHMSVELSEMVCL